MRLLTANSAMVSPRRVRVRRRLRAAEATNLGFLALILPRLVSRLYRDHCPGREVPPVVAVTV